MLIKNKLIHGVGINDADYLLSIKEYTGEHYPSGKKKRRNVWRCPFYIRWTDMLKRCYSKAHQGTQPTYRDCYVCEEWLTFSNFSSWMGTQPWQVGKGENAVHLDKDLLFQGNKGYSPSTCVFIHSKVNNFLLESGGSRGDCLIGCYWSKRDGIFQAYCNNPFTMKLENVGSFESEIEAHLAWKCRKHLYACQLADSRYVVQDRVAEALLNRYKQ